MSELLVLGFGFPVFLGRGVTGRSCQLKFECGRCEMLVFRVVPERIFISLVCIVTLTSMTGFINDY